MKLTAKKQRNRKLLKSILYSFLLMYVLTATGYLLFDDFEKGFWFKNALTSLLCAIPTTLLIHGISDEELLKNPCDRKHSIQS